MFIRAILFDLIGTTVFENDPALINQCFRRAFHDHGVAVSDEFIRDNRGRNKKEMILRALAASGKDVGLADAINRSFKIQIRENVDNFYPAPGATDLFRYLKQKSKIVGIGTGLSEDNFTGLFDHLGWVSIGFDYVGISEKIGRGRPHPDMILDMMDRHAIAPREFLKVGDTVADIQEGKNAGVQTAVILSGTQPRGDLLAAGPDYLLTSLEEIKTLVS